jgi:hypothetical protein
MGLSFLIGDRSGLSIKLLIRIDGKICIFLVGQCKICAQLLAEYKNLYAGEAFKIIRIKAAC